MNNFISAILIFCFSLQLSAQTYVQGPNLIEVPHSQATAAGTTTFTSSAATVQIFTGSTTQTAVLPSATTLQVGRRFYISNQSTGTVTVNFNGGSLAATLLSGQQASFRVTANGTSAGTWDVAKAGALPLPTSSTLGGVQSAASASHQWINSISTSGVPALSQPAFSDISGSVASTQMPALTGDITSSAGAVATTLATVNSNVGTFGSTSLVPIITVNAKGLVTGASSVAVTSVPPAGFAARNLLINSDFIFNQRAGTITVANAAKGMIADRWWANNTLGSAGVITNTFTTMAGPTGVGVRTPFINDLHVSTAPTTAINGNAFSLSQFLENADSLIAYNNTVSGSAYVKAQGNITSVNLAMVYNTTQVSTAGNTLGSAASCTVNSSTWTLCTVSNISVSTTPTTSGVIGLSVQVAGASSGHNSDLNNGFYTTAAMFNIGSSAATWSPAGATIGDELRMAQRFYEKSYELTTVPGASTNTVGALFAGQPAAGVSAQPIIVIGFYKAEKVQNVAPTYYNTSSGATGSCRDNGAGADKSLTTQSNGSHNFNVITASLGGFESCSFHFTDDAEF